MIQPPFLKAGDTIGILSTARRTDAAAMEKARLIIENHGYKVVLAPNLFAHENQYAGSDALRIADMHTLLQDPEVKAILCARGGYGTTRIIDQVDWSLLKLQPKWICGFSDVTAILCHLQRQGFESLHCTMAGLFDTASEERAASVESIFKLLQGAPLELTTPPHPFNRPGQASGQLIGGNLSILSTLSGTASDPDYSGKILFMEDLDEYLYHIDRMMVQLKRSGKLAQLAGVVIGQMSDMNDNAVPFGKTAYEIIQEHLSTYSFPVAFGFPVGHEPLNMALPVGREVELLISSERVLLKQLHA